MNTIILVLPWVQLGSSIFLILLVLLQRPADGIEGSLMGGTGSNMTYFARRGSERVLFITTIIVAVLFAVASLVSLLA